MCILTHSSLAAYRSSSVEPVSCSQWASWLAAILHPGWIWYEVYMTRAMFGLDSNRRTDRQTETRFVLRTRAILQYVRDDGNVSQYYNYKNLWALTVTILKNISTRLKIPWSQTCLILWCVFKHASDRNNFGTTLAKVGADLPLVKPWSQVGL